MNARPAAFPALAAPAAEAHRAPDAGWHRRARPLLGTLVEVGVPCSDTHANRWADIAFEAIAAVQACLSRFEPASEVARFNALAAGEEIEVGAHAQAVLSAARRLQHESAGLFDASLGSAPDGWRLDGSRLRKLSPAVRLSLDGIAKGHAVDCAVQALRQAGCESGWVNAGGDLRSFGSARVAVQLRDEAGGGVRAFASLLDGAFATSHYDARSRCRLAEPGADPASPAPAPMPRAHAAVHVSVAAPLCLWADALTKLVALSGDAMHPLLAGFGAQAWLHAFPAHPQ